MDWKKQFATVYACGLGALLGMMFLPQKTLLLTLVGAGLVLVSVCINPKRERILFALIVFILGASAEIFATQFGAWKYPSPSVYGIPYWIPFMWVVVGFAILEIQVLVRHLLRKS